MSERRSHSDAVKRKAVERLLAGRITITELAEEKDISATVLRTWSRDPRWGGKPGAFARNGGAAANGGLPTTKRQPSKRAKRPVPVVYACPHCGGLIDMGGDT